MHLLNERIARLEAQLAQPAPASSQRKAKASDAPSKKPAPSATTGARKTPKPKAAAPKTARRTAD
jgi:hypothetical protein